MRLASLLVCLVLVPVAFAGGTVGYNVNWYSTPGFPFNDLVDGFDCEVTTGVVIADFNRDGIPDVAYSSPTCGSSGGGVIVKLGTGGGNLGPDIFTGWGADTLSELATADINGDGWLDLVVRDPLGGCLIYLQGNGDGTFQIQWGVACGASPVGSFTLGDFNHDGKIDVADIACDQVNAGAAFPHNSANCALNIYLGDGAGNFTSAQSIQLAGPSYDLQSADINGDGNLDLVYVRSNYDSATDKYSGVGTIRWGHGDGTFATSNATYLKPAITNRLDAVAVADFDNDGRLDVALLAGRPCGPVSCGLATVDTVWMYKNNGGNNFTLASQTKFAQHGGTIIAADVNGDLNQDLIYYNPFASGIYPVLSWSAGFDYVLGLGKDTLGTQGNLAGGGLTTAAAFRDMDGDSRADYAVIDWEGQLGVAIQTGGYKNCPPPSSANLAAKICGIKDGATIASPVLVRASGNSPAGVSQLQVWIDGKKKYVKWGDQLAKKFTLSSGKHRIAVTANDKYIGSAKTVVNIIVP
jgi:FG-GAP-like repeat